MGVIYLDSCLLVYVVEEHPVFVMPVRNAIDAESEIEFVISPLVKLECLVKPLMSGNTAIKKRYESAFSVLTTVNMPEEVYLDAALLRARFKLKTPDAIHLSCCQHHQCTSLWTNDNRFANSGHGVIKNILKS